MSNNDFNMLSLPSPPPVVPQQRWAPSWWTSNLNRLWDPNHGYSFWGWRANEYPPGNGQTASQAYQAQFDPNAPPLPDSISRWRRDRTANGEEYYYWLNEDGSKFRAYDQYGRPNEKLEGGGKKIRKHSGIHQTGGKAGKLKKGYKYSGKKLKNGKAEIKKVKSKKVKSKKVKSKKVKSKK